MSNGNGEEERWQRALRDLQRLMGRYEQAKRSGDEALSNGLAHEIVRTMQRLATMHSDPRVRELWRNRAEEFSAADADVKAHILDDIGKGLLILLATPFALVGAVLFAAGGIVYGVGSVVKGLGKVFTLGWLG
jgi:hypothetical protein